mgnify:CR=1 FL=1
MHSFLSTVYKVSNVLPIFSTSSDVSGMKKDLIIIVWSEKGLCGWLNVRLFKKIMHDFDPVSTDCFVVGKKAAEFCHKQGYQVVGKCHLKDDFSDVELQNLYAFLHQTLKKNPYKTISVVFNFFKNTLQQIPVILQTYPLDRKVIEDFFTKIWISELLIEKKPMFHWILLEPSRAKLAKSLSEQLMNYVVYGTVLQNKTGEMAARMLAMKKAKDNAADRIKYLTIAFNKARQWAITQEIMEIVAAKAAITDEK